MAVINADTGPSSFDKILGITRMAMGDPSGITQLSSNPGLQKAGMLYGLGLTAGGAGTGVGAGAEASVESGVPTLDNYLRQRMMYGR